MGSTILKLDSVTKNFGALKVADNVSFEVSKGQALGIIGPNGAGKSTLFNLIGGNLRSNSGTILLSERDITTLSATERCDAGIGRSFQIPRPFQRMTVLENLLVGAVFGGKLAQAPAVEACVDVLDQTNLLAKANTLAGELSLLERKRLELARGLATQPQLLLLDEIAGGLTEPECNELVATIRRVIANGVTIIWIEHVLHALTSVVDDLLVLDFGRVIARGNPDTVMALDEVREIYLGMEV